MTLQPWRIYNPSFRYRHSVYEGLNAHVLARDDGRDQPPGGLPPGPQAALPLIMHEMTHLRCQSQFPSLCFFELLSAASSVSADRGVRVSVFCSAPIQARAGLRSSLTLRPLSSDVATLHPLLSCLSAPFPLGSLGLLWTTIIRSILLDLRSSSKEDGRPQPVKLEGTRFFLRFSSISGLRRRRMGVPSQ